MTIELRRSGAEDFAAIVELDGASFGFHYSEQAFADARLDIDPEQALVAVDEGRVVGVSAELPMRMSVPGGRDVPTMGLTWVSVDVTRRRRGLLRTMIERQLREHAEAGYAACVLTASEAGIYGRYGFGVATQVRRTVLQRRRAEFAACVDTSAVRRLTTVEARSVLPQLHERWRQQTPGAISRGEPRWKLGLLDREHQRGGMSGLFHLVHPDGYVTYRIKSDWRDADAEHLCWLVDYIPITAEAHAALWQTLLGIDLVTTIESHRVPLDDALPHLLTDYRRVRTTALVDGMWLRPLDVPQLLAARRYAIEVRTVVEVRDQLLGDGRYLVQGSGVEATCARTDRTADVVLDVASLGAAYLGGTRLSTLARAGRVVGDPDAITRLDRALLADRLPFHGSEI